MSNRIFGSKTFYAVQVGIEDNAGDYGSTNYREAEKMARNAMLKNKHDEIRIAILNADTGYCGDVIVIRPQTRLFVAYRESGDLITECGSIDEGKQIIREYEHDDKADESYTPDSYDIVWEDDRTSVLF